MASVDAYFHASAGTPELHNLRPDGISYIPDKDEWVVYDYTRGTPNILGTAHELGMTKETKESYVDLIKAMRLHLKVTVEFIPLATTYEGAFLMNCWERLAEVLYWEEDRLPELL